VHKKGRHRDRSPSSRPRPNETAQLKLCHGGIRVVKPPSEVDLAAAEQAAAAFLVALGVDLDTESLAATPARMARAYAEMFTHARST
jgi:GTP cyclohydrolase I